MDDFDGLINPEIYLNNINQGLLKGKTLNKLPEVRQALGEITGYLEAGSGNILKATKVQNYLTVKKTCNNCWTTQSLQSNFKRKQQRGSY